MRDIESIDSELRLLASAPFSPRARCEPFSRQVDELLDERLAHRGWPREDTAVET